MIVFPLTPLNIRIGFPRYPHDPYSLLRLPIVIEILSSISSLRRPVLFPAPLKRYSSCFLGSVGDGVVGWVLGGFRVGVGSFGGIVCFWFGLGFCFFGCFFFFLVVLVGLGVWGCWSVGVIWVVVPVLDPIRRAVLTCWIPSSPSLRRLFYSASARPRPMRTFKYDSFAFSLALLSGPSCSQSFPWIFDRLLGALILTVLL